MRILTCYYKPKPGGLCKRLVMSMEALLENGHEVHYLAVEKFPVTHDDCHFHKFPWPSKYADGLLFWLFFLSFSVPVLTYLAFRYRIDRIYCFSSTYGIALQAARILKRIPLYIFLRADVITNHEIKGTSKLIITAEKLMEGFAIYHAHVYGVSEALIDDIANRHNILKPLSTGVLRNNIDSHITTTSSTSSGDTRHTLRLGCAGILEPRKNQSLLIDLAASLRNRDIHLNLYGTGPLEHDLRQQVKRLDLEQHVSFHGWTPVQDILRETDLMLTPSLHEGAPNIILECLANNVPVLASDIPEHREVLPESCLLALDATVWSDAISGILEHPDSRLQSLVNDLRPYKDKLSFDWKKHFVNVLTGSVADHA